MTAHRGPASKPHVSGQIRGSLHTGNATWTRRARPAFHASEAIRIRGAGNSSARAAFCACSHHATPYSGLSACEQQKQQHPIHRRQHKLEMRTSSIAKSSSTSAAICCESRYGSSIAGHIPSHRTTKVSLRLSPQCCKEPKNLNRRSDSTDSVDSNVVMDDIIVEITVANSILESTSGMAHNTIDPPPQSSGDDSGVYVVVATSIVVKLSSLAALAASSTSSTVLWPSSYLANSSGLEWRA